jgi:hypothetical protein
MNEKDRLIQLIRRLVKKGGALQSTGAAESVNTAALEQNLRSTLTDHIAHDVAGMLRSVVGDEPETRLSRVELANLEAIVHVIGRPAMRYTNGRVAMPPNDIGDNERWRVIVATTRSEIDKASAGVGRITLGEGAPPAIQGTGWRIGADLAVTNRHVACTLVENPADAPSSWRIDRTKQPAIDFERANSRFAIVACAYAAPADGPDFAVVRLATEGAAPPPALKIGLDPLVSANDEVYVVGHPYRTWASSISFH